MATAFEWLSTIMETVIKFCPHLKIVKITQGGLKYRKGNEITKLEPGLVWYWPIITAIDVITVVRDTLDLNGQTLVTKDGKSMLASGMIMFSVNDVEKLLTTAPDYTSTICDLSMNVIHDTFIQYEWEQIRVGLLDGTIGRELKRKAQDELRPFGIKVISLGLKDRAPVKVIKLVQDS